MREFEAAVEHYGRAMELYDEDISFLTNRCMPPLSHLCSLRMVYTDVILHPAKYDGTAVQTHTGVASKFFGVQRRV